MEDLDDDEDFEEPVASEGRHVREVKLEEETMKLPL